MHDRFAAAGRAPPSPSGSPYRGLRLCTGPWLDIRVADVELSDGRHLDHRLIRRRTVGTE
ncbi:hypothetical protein GCM10009734_34680 [Nonomuraea bangladeshensis]